MTDTAASGSANGPPASHGALRVSVLHVCTSCRAPGWPREPREHRPGFRLYQELRATFDGSPLGRHVEVRSAKCLSLCPRPCGIALSSPGAWTYLFGDQRPGNSARDIVECVSAYVGTSDGFMPRERRPKPLRASILGRVPPTGEGPGPPAGGLPPRSQAVGWSALSERPVVWSLRQCPFGQTQRVRRRALTRLPGRHPAPSPVSPCRREKTEPADR